MRSTVVGCSDPQGQSGFCHLWWTQLEPILRRDGLVGSVAEQRTQRRNWIRATLASVTDDGDDAIAAVGRAPWSSALGGWRAGWSSCDGIVVLAFGPRPVAVDVERDRPVTPGMDRRFGLAHDGFWQGWTRKEAALKLLGTGLRVDPVRIGVSESGGVTLDGWPLPIRVADLSAPAGHVAAIACLAEDRARNA